MRTRYCLLALTLAFVPVLAAGGCSGKKEDATSGPTGQATTVDQTEISVAGSDSQVVVLVESVPTTLDPYQMVSYPADSIAAHLWDTLVWLNDDLELEPSLAESWQLVNDHTWELELRRDVVFHNGEPFDARAVEFSLERTAQLPGSLETFASEVALESVEIVGDYTVRIHTTKPAVSMIYELSTVEMLPPGYYAQAAEDLARNPIGSGPYQLVDWSPGEHVVLEANSDYWRGVPAVPTLVFRVESDVDQRIAKLVEGDADLIADLPPDKAEVANTDQTRMVAIESTRRLFVGLQCRDGTPLADKRVRQALNYAVDVRALIIEFYAGYGERYGSWVNPPNANPDLSPWPYDPQKAQDLLAEAGYPNGLEIVMDVPIERYYRGQEIAEAIATRMAVAGVWVTIQPQEWSEFVRERLIPRETAPLFLLSLMSWGDGLEDTRNLAYDFPFNPTLWREDEFEELLSQAEQTFDQDLRLSLLYKAQAIAYEEAPWIWLWRPYLFYGVSQDLDWWQPRADGLIYLYTPSLRTGAE